MKSVRWYANQILVPAVSVVSNKDAEYVFENAVEIIEQIRREQHEATIHALQDSYLKTGVYRASFESTQEDK